MIPATAQQLQVLKSSNREMLQFVRVREFGASTDMLAWVDGDQDEVSAGVSYTSDNPMLRIAGEQSETTFSRGIIGLEIADPNGTWFRRFRLAGQGVNLRAWVSLAFRGLDNNVLTPLFTNTILNGDGVDKKVTEEGLVTTVRFRNLLAKLDASNPLTTTDASQHEVDATDTAFTYSDESIVYTWGQG